MQTPPRVGAPRRLGRLQRAPAAREGVIHRLVPEPPEWRWLSFVAYALDEGGHIGRSGDDEEVLVLALEGTVTVTVDGRSVGELGTRDTVFDSAPAGVFLCQPGRDVEVVAARGALVVLASAPSGDVRRTAIVPADEILVETRGEGSAQRTIKQLLPATAKAGRLIAVEAYTPGGNWSSYPPHKHDTDDPPRESQLEELYFYRFARPGGFAFQRVYTADGSLDETMTATDRDLILVPRGYHVVGAAAGYDCYYLNVMAGPTRRWQFTVDAAHRWLMDWDPARPRAQDRGGGARETSG